MYNACQKSLEHLGHFFIICISNHSNQVQIPHHPRNNVDFRRLLSQHSSRAADRPVIPIFFSTKQHCSEGESRKSQNKAKLAEVLQDFWQALT